MPLGAELHSERDSCGEDIHPDLFVVMLFYTWEGFYIVSFLLGEGEEKESFVKCLSWVAGRPAYGECQLRLGPDMALRTMQEKKPSARRSTASSWSSGSVVGWSLPTRSRTLIPTLPEHTTAETEGASRGKEPAPESSGKSASATMIPALVIQAGMEAFLWCVASSRQYWNERSHRPSTTSELGVRM